MGRQTGTAPKAPARSRRSVSMVISNVAARACAGAGGKRAAAPEQSPRRRRHETQTAAERDDLGCFLCGLARSAAACLISARPRPRRAHEESNPDFHRSVSIQGPGYDHQLAGQPFGPTVERGPIRGRRVNRGVCAARLFGKGAQRRADIASGSLHRPITIIEGSRRCRPPPQSFRPAVAARVNDVATGHDRRKASLCSNHLTRKRDTLQHRAPGVVSGSIRRAALSLFQSSSAR
jgi:hypothetical protein